MSNNYSVVKLHIPSFKCEINIRITVFRVLWLFYPLMYIYNLTCVSLLLLFYQTIVLDFLSPLLYRNNILLFNLSLFGSYNFSIKFINFKIIYCWYGCSTTLNVTFFGNQSEFWILNFVFLIYLCWALLRTSYD